MASGLASGFGAQRERPADPHWARLLDAETRLEADISAAQVEARARVAAARAAAAAALPDAAALEAQAAAQEQADREQHGQELARLAQQADSAVRALAEAPDAWVQTLAQLALDAALADEPVARQS